MWRFANYLYRTIRNVTTHRCPQDILVPAATVCNKDDEHHPAEKPDHGVEPLKVDVDRVVKTAQFSSASFEQLLERLQRISFAQVTGCNLSKPAVIEHRAQEAPPPPQRELSVDALLQADETCVQAIQSLSELHEETMETIDNQMAIDALESGNAQLGVELLQASVKSGKNAAALYNLGICYERGIGVAEDRAKACDYYRRASILGHANAQLNLNLLSNQVDVSEDEDEPSEQTTPTNKPYLFRFSFIHGDKELSSSSSWNGYPLNLTKTVACLA